MKSKKKGFWERAIEDLHKFEKKEGIKTQLSTQEALIEPLAIFSVIAFGDKMMEKIT